MNKNSGFTLIELLIVMVIVGILMAVAIPGYSSYIRKTQRTEAQALLIEVAGKQVRYHSENNTYTAVIGELGYGAAASTTYESEHQTYDISVSAANGTSFTLLAVPKNTQSSDDCGSLGINSAGVKSITGAGVTVQDCW